MARIRILPDRVANQIAAGEVVERPVAVVKELVENSLDAGATQITVEFRKGGKAFIAVQDNGAGMSADEAHLALERHATSKIAEADDLNRVGTFGFRGEALPSIASVSRFILRTRNEGWEAGTEITINGGKHADSREVGMPRGTRIEVSHLFNSVPARRKFLKTDRTESAHIVRLCRLLAVAHPEVSFSLVEDGRTVFRSPICPTLKERVGEVFGANLGDELLEIEAEDNGMCLTGLIGRPGVSRSTRQELVAYVNRRPIDSRLLNFALIESYHTYIPKGRYPVAFVFLQVAPDRVDVNVHPAKREVRFREEPAVRRFLMEAVLDRLTEAAREVRFERPEAKAEPPARPQAEPARPEPPPKTDPARSKAAALLQKHAVAQKQAPASKPRPSSESPPEKKQPAPPKPSEMASQPRLSWRFLGLAHGNYATFETPGGVVLLEIRAARARILFERFLASLQTGETPRQSLLFAIELELDAQNAAVLEEHLDFFTQNGFTVEAFGGTMFRIREVPEWFDAGEAGDFVRDVVALIRERGLRPHQDKAVARAELARMASLQAVRVRQATTAEEMQRLAQELLQCENPLTDPKGRPTYFELSRAELDRRFSR